MKLLLLTPGTGSFHCGSCIRDNALARAMRKCGHDVTMLPMYLPLVLDEPSAAVDEPVFFGGVNVYLQQKSSLFRHTPRWLDALLDQPGVLSLAAKKAGSTTPSQLGEITLSMLQGEAGHQRKELDRLVLFLREHEQPDIIMLNNVLLIGLARAMRERVGAKVICTLQGEDAYLDALDEPWRSRAWDAIRARAGDVDQFVAVSRYYGDLMRARLKLTESAVTVIPNGIDLAAYPAQPLVPVTPTLGYLARMHPTKGLDAAVSTFIELKRRDRVPGLRILLVGSISPADRAYADAQWLRLLDAGVADAASLHGNVSHGEKIALLSKCSVLSVPATYGESFGLYVVEAMAAGVPVVQPRQAAFVELVESTAGGVLVPPGDVLAAADAIEALLLDEPRRMATAQAAHRAVRDGYSIERMAERMESLCCKLLPRAADMSPGR